MVDGLWTMKFQANTGKTGFGAAVFANGKILGGDSSYFYFGSYTLQGDILTGEVKVTNYSGLVSSLFGSSMGTGLKVKGKIEDHAFLLSGYMCHQPSVTLTIRGTKREACRTQAA
jgi:hypothetical protein